MSAILETLSGRDVRRIEEGEAIITQGDSTGCLYFLIDGSVEILKDDTPVALASTPGVVFGEMAALLGGEHTATVRAVAPSSFYVVENAREFLKESPGLCVHVCELLARRLDSLNKYLVDVKHQFEGHDHIGMIDSVLEALLHRQPRDRVRPKDSTIGEPV
jgi:CRP-like cAMP-binding protein